MAVPCRHCTDILQFLDSPVTVVGVAAIGQAMHISMAAGLGLDEETDTGRVSPMQSHGKFPTSRSTMPGSEPPAMGDAHVLPEVWQVYERIMVQRNRATLPRGRTRPPHEVYPSCVLPDLQGDKQPDSHNCETGPVEKFARSCDYRLDWARGCGRDSPENSCGSAITLGMTVPCHHCTDMLRFMDSPVTVVKGAAIGEGIRSSVAVGSK
ncbi:hypothetical protein CSKR_108429 [Clonorchis sinensis]|uniref:Uncharacterized protein n=1 Tax=Clonorchis sinensis TaxID=79923 RepID=A0A3R7H002_CLOSI|nr:hypothetical protein CSKR_108429 [Clonorchis sinensis]